MAIQYERIALLLMLHLKRLSVQHCSCVAHYVAIPLSFAQLRTNMFIEIDIVMMSTNTSSFACGTILIYIM